MELRSSPDVLPQLAYAPTPYSYTPSHSLTATVNLDEEIKLADSSAERDLYESLAEIYSIIITLDALEKAYLRDSIKESEYTETCDRLLRQYKSCLADDTVLAAFGDLENFKAEWDLEVPKATERLRIGLPATTETAPSRAASQRQPPGPSSTPAAAATHIVSASENFITLFDAVRMNMLSKDTLHPILVETIQAVNKVTDRDFDNKGKIVQWLITLNQMRAAEELSPEQARELQFDLNAAYDGFKATLESGGNEQEAKQTAMASPKATDDQEGEQMEGIQEEDKSKDRIQEDKPMDGIREDEPLDVMDLPQLYQRPSASALLSTLGDLSVVPQPWDDATNLQSRQVKRKINSDGVPAYLTKIIASPLSWIEDDALREQIWEAASKRLSERSGRSGMGAFTRTFRIQIESNVVPSTEADQILEIKLHEPALTADNLGLKTWASSYLLAKRLSSLRETFHSIDPDEQLLELGAGTGLVGLAAAATFQAHVVLTDLPDIVPNLERNRLANETKLLMRGGSAETAVLNWSDPSAFMTRTSGTGRQPRNSFRVILAADPIYSSDHPRLLVQTIWNHLSRDRNARVIIELPLRESFTAERQDLRERMEKAGLDVLNEGEEIGYDDWSDDKDGEKLAEVRCWWSVWSWR